MIPNPTASTPIVNKEGVMEEPFRLFTLALSFLDIETGSGSPEGVVTSNIKTLYMDTAGTAGSILYIKRDESIAGDKSQGWILV